MRVYEILLAVSGGSLALTRCIGIGEIIPAAFTALMAICLVLGASTDGLRAIQLVMPLMFLFEAINWYIDITFALPYTHLFISMTYLLLVWFFGMMNFKGTEPTGPYKVGYSERFTTKYGNFCAVYYPADPDAVMGTTGHGFIDGPGKEAGIRKVMAWTQPDK